MPKEQGLLRRLLVKVTPQFVEDWKGRAGNWWRHGTDKIAQVNEEHLQLGDKLKETPDMLWKLALGATSTQHAQAEANYAKSENDRIEAELKRRTLEANTRKICADADKAETQARIERINEAKARIELAKLLNENGAAMTTQGNAIAFTPAPTLPPSTPKIFDPEEEAFIQEHLVPAITDILPDQHGFERNLGWIKDPGDHVMMGEHIAEIIVQSSPPIHHRVDAPVAGIIYQIIHKVDTVKHIELLAYILPDDPRPAADKNDGDIRPTG